MPSDSKLIIEARINEDQMRERNPNVPWTPAEIADDAARCREAGASVVHFHARRPDGAPELSADAYADIIARIRARSDILVHPTLGSHKPGGSVPERLRPMLALAERPETRPDILPLCLSSPNWDFFDPETRRFQWADKVYLNPTDELIESARLLTGAGIGVSCVCWEVGATRRTAAFLEAGILPRPVYLPFHLTSGGMLAGHPGTEAGLDAHLAFLPADPDAVVWAVINLHGSVLPLADKAIRAGGHVQIGIGDHAYAEEGAPTNAELVRRVADTAERLGRGVAAPAEARALLGLDAAAGGTG